MWSRGDYSQQCSRRISSSFQGSNQVLMIKPEINEYKTKLSTLILYFQPVPCLFNPGLYNSRNSRISRQVYSLGSLPLILSLFSWSVHSNSSSFFITSLFLLFPPFCLTSPTGFPGWWTHSDDRVIEDYTIIVLILIATIWPKGNFNPNFSTVVHV